MKSPDLRAAVLGEWIEKAEGDFAVAAYIVKGRDRSMAPAVCFHSQQAVEKYLKAILVFRGIAFPKSHEIGKLLALMAAADRPVLSQSAQDRLTDYATVFRYPGQYEPITLTEAAERLPWPAASEPTRGRYSPRRLHFERRSDFGNQQTRRAMASSGRAAASTRTRHRANSNL